MNNPILDLIEQQNAIDEQAWITFIDEYDRRNPAPNEKRSMLQIGMLVGLIASLTLSGLMTIPAFMRVLDAAGTWQPISFAGGLAGFISVDLVMFFSTYYLVNTYYKPKALEGNVDMSQLMKAFSIAAGFGFLVSAGSNIYFVMIGYNVIDINSNVGLIASFMVGLLLALAPPIQASATGSIMALLPLTTLMEREAYERSRNAAWHRYKSKRGLNLNVEKLTEQYMENAINRLGYVPEMAQVTVSNSYQQTNHAQSLRKKVALEYLKKDSARYETIRQTVLEGNPTATQTDIAKAIANEMAGDDRGYMTVMRAYKELGLEL